MKDETAFVWYETPLPITEKGKCQHIDAVVFSRKTNSVFFIESKRLGDRPTGQIKRVLKDIKRILDTKEVCDIKSGNDDKFTNRGYILKEWPHGGQSALNQYVICIMDYWKDHYEFDDVKKIISEKISGIIPDKELFIESIGVKESFTCPFDDDINHVDNADTAVRKYSIHLAAIKI